jgi:hypothetical protein
MSAPIFGEGVIRRERFRRQRMEDEERQEIVTRVLEFARDDIDNRAEDRDRRLQRYAKYRQWTEGKHEPWENSSDVALSDIAEAVLNTQDTLTNAILSNRPVVSANAIKLENSEKERSIDRVLDSQFFIEQPGERIVEELGESFLVDGVFTAYIPWIRETKPVVDIRIFDPIPNESPPVTHFQDLLAQEFRNSDVFQTDEDGWDYRIKTYDVEESEEESLVKFYTRKSDKHVEMMIHRVTTVFDGPRVIVKDYEDVLVPPRVANLQPPGPSNPGGAPHVILVDNPTVEEIERLKKSGYYDLVRSDEMDDVDDLGFRSRDDTDEEAKEQKDDMQGVQDERALDRRHETLTRYMCFDMYDLDGDGLAEDVIFWVLKEDNLLLKAAPLTEFFPADPPRRPLAEAQFLPVKGRREGISLPELMEGLHDFLKQTLDHGMDGGTLATTPFFFYRAASSLKPEIIRPWPGDGIPLSDPQRDVFFPQIPFDGSFSLNAFFMGRQLQERLTLVGDLQAGRVPQGKSSALRTSAGINTILAQGEARPERILRRFFMGFAEIYRQMHELNQHFYPDEKQIRVLGIVEPGENPYPKIVRRHDLDGRFVFDFRASVLNASKVAKEQGLEKIVSMLINPLMIQLGIVGPEQIFRMVRDYAQSLGQDPDRYMKEPVPGAGKRRITANEALSVIFDHMLPDGIPAEPSAQDHLDQLRGFMQDDRFGLLDASQLDIFKSWLVQVAQLAIQEEGQQKIAKMAEAFQQKSAIGAGGGVGGGGAEAPISPPGTPTESGEVLDETLPSNGRGIN